MTASAAAANGALYTLLAQPSAIPPTAQNEKDFLRILHDIDAITIDLQTLQSATPPSQHLGFATVLNSLAAYRDSVAATASRLTANTPAAGRLLQPFQAAYAGMTASLHAVSQNVAASSQKHALD
jgi:hypothetical protein